MFLPSIAANTIDGFIHSAYSQLVETTAMELG